MVLFRDQRNLGLPLLVVTKFHFGHLMLAAVGRVRHLVPLAHFGNHDQFCVRLGILAFINLILGLFLSVDEELGVLLGALRRFATSLHDLDPLGLFGRGLVTCSESGGA